jgi:hypothetical protein
MVSKVLDQNMRLVPGANVKAAGATVRPKDVLITVTVPRPATRHTGMAKTTTLALCDSALTVAPHTRTPVTSAPDPRWLPLSVTTVRAVAAPAAGWTECTTPAACTTNQRLQTMTTYVRGLNVYASALLLVLPNDSDCTSIPQRPGIAEGDITTVTLELFCDWMT